MTQTFTLLNLLINNREISLNLVLLVEGRHAELLVHQSLLLATRRAISVVRIVAEVRRVCLSINCRVDGFDATQEALLLYNGYGKFLYPQ